MDNETSPTQDVAYTSSRRDSAEVQKRSIDANVNLYLRRVSEEMSCPKCNKSDPPRTAKSNPNPIKPEITNAPDSNDNIIFGPKLPPGFAGNCESSSNHETKLTIKSADSASYTPLQKHSLRKPSERSTYGEIHPLHTSRKGRKPYDKKSVRRTKRKQVNGDLTQERMTHTPMYNSSVQSGSEKSYIPRDESITSINQVEYRAKIIENVLPMDRSIKQVFYKKKPVERMHVKDSKQVLLSQKSTKDVEYIQHRAQQFANQQHIIGDVKPNKIPKTFLIKSNVSGNKKRTKKTHRPDVDQMKISEELIITDKRHQIGIDKSKYVEDVQITKTHMCIDQLKHIENKKITKTSPQISINKLKLKEELKIMKTPPEIILNQTEPIEDVKQYTIPYGQGLNYPNNSVDIQNRSRNDCFNHILKLPSFSGNIHNKMSALQQVSMINKSQNPTKKLQLHRGAPRILLDNSRTLRGQALADHLLSIKENIKPQSLSKSNSSTPSRKYNMSKRKRGHVQMQNKQSADIDQCPKIDVISGDPYKQFIGSYPKYQYIRPSSFVETIPLIDPSQQYPKEAISQYPIMNTTLAPTFQENPSSSQTHLCSFNCPPMIPEQYSTDARIITRLPRNEVLRQGVNGMNLASMSTHEQIPHNRVYYNASSSQNKKQETVPTTMHFCNTLYSQAPRQSDSIAYALQVDKNIEGTSTSQLSQHCINSSSYPHRPSHQFAYRSAFPAYTSPEQAGGVVESGLETVKSEQRPSSSRWKNTEVTYEKCVPRYSYDSIK